MDILIFQSAILFSLLVFFVNIRLKYFLVLLPVLAIIGVSSYWAIDVLISNQTKTHLLSFNISEQIFGFWSQTPHLVIDQISALFILMINVVSLGAFIYAYGYLKKYLALKSPLGMSMHYFSFFLVYISMLLITMMREGFMFLFVWELMTLSAYLMVAFHGEKENIRKVAINYLMQMHLGFLFLLAGFLIVNKETGIWGFEALEVYFASHDNYLVFLLFFVGFGVKAGLIPFHTWLPHAHPAAPAYVSATMSGVIVKMGVYGVLRVLTHVQSQLFEIGLTMLIVSLVTILFSISMAVFQRDLKKLLAYSTIENIGIIFLGISLSILGRAYNVQALAVLAMMGTLFHVLNHSLYKSMLFMLCGNIEKITNTRNINELGGLAKKMPFTTAFFLLGSLALCALPPFNGFVGEFLIYKGIYRAIADGGFFISIVAIVSIIFMALSGGICIYAMTKAFGLSFLGSSRKPFPEPLHEPSKSMFFPAFLNTILILAIGLAPVLILPQLQETLSAFKFIPKSSQVYQVQTAVFQKFGLLSLILITLFFLVYLVRYLQQKRVQVMHGPTWGCGYEAGDAKHQYTSTSYSKSMQNIVSPLLQETNTYQSFEEEEIFPGERKYQTTVKDRLEESVILRPINYLLNRIPKLGLAQTGRIQHYLIYPMAFLLLIALLSAFGII